MTPRPATVWRGCLCDDDIAVEPLRGDFAADELFDRIIVQELLAIILGIAFSIGANYIDTQLETPRPN
jgi:hypothetical protein